MPQTPEMFILGGPNGAGKSTTAAVLLPERVAVQGFVNADVIAEAMPPGSTPLDAGRTMLARLHELRDRRETFAFETTLAARTYAPFIRGAQSAGYAVHLIDIWLFSVELACSRVRDRVREGGHDVSRADIERRYRRGLRNLVELYRPLADTWVVCDNSDKSMLFVAQGNRDGATTIREPRYYDRIERAARIQS